jgi:excisionase family DNA binding protein
MPDYPAYWKKRNMWERSLGKEAYTVAEVARMLDRSPKTVNRWIKSGKLYAERTGDRKTVIPKKAIIDFMVPPLHPGWWA